MATLTFDLAEFRVRFPAFAAKTDAALISWYEVATFYMSAEDYGLLAGDTRAYGLQLMTAHLTLLSDRVVAGKPIQGLTESASIDKVAVTLKVAPAMTQWQWWLAMTPYGSQLWALLQISSAAGFYVGGLPERSAFRKVGGVF